VIGAMFLALYAFGLLPGLFAWPAGLGDAAVGLAAPFVLLAMLRGAPNWPRRVAWLNIAGLVDFAGAIGTGVLTSNSSLGVLADGAPHAKPGRTAAQPRSHLRSAAVDHLPHDLAVAVAGDEANERSRGRLKVPLAAQFVRHAASPSLARRAGVGFEPVTPAGRLSACPLPTWRSLPRAGSGRNP